MAISIDATSQGETAAGTSLTIAHTCTGTTRALYVSATTFNSGGAATVTATYAGAAMTEKTNTIFGNLNNERITVFEKIAPASGANNIVITASISSEIVMAALSLNATGVMSSGVASATAPDNVTTVSQVISSAANDLVVDAVGFFSGTLTVGAGQTQRVYNNNGPDLESTAISTEPGAASVTMSEDFSVGEYPGHIAWNVTEAAGAAAAIGARVMHRPAMRSGRW